MNNIPTMRRLSTKLPVNYYRKESLDYTIDWNRLRCIRKGIKQPQIKLDNSFGHPLSLLATSRKSAKFAKRIKLDICSFQTLFGRNKILHNELFAKVLATLIKHYHQITHFALSPHPLVTKQQLYAFAGLLKQLKQLESLSLDFSCLYAIDDEIVLTIFLLHDTNLKQK